VKRETGDVKPESHLTKTKLPMFLQLNHKSLHVFAAFRELVKEVYAITLLLPAEEKFNMVSQLRREALSVKLNLAEGASREAVAERGRYIEVARGSVVEIAAALETAVDLTYLQHEQLIIASELLNKCFAMLSNMLE
jgi:four helix bundle protein